MNKKQKKKEVSNPAKDAENLEKSGKFESAQSARDYIFYLNWLYLHT